MDGHGLGRTEFGIFEILLGLVEIDDWQIEVGGPSNRFVVTFFEAHFAFLANAFAWVIGQLLVRVLAFRVGAPNTFERAPL